MFNESDQSGIEVKEPRFRFFYIALILIASILICVPIYYNGVPTGNGYDLPQHYQFAQVIYDTVQNGKIYPDWIAATNAGYGDVGLRFYPPLAYYVLAGFRGLAGNWYSASFLTFTFWFFLSGLGIYLWAREWFEENASLFAALVYIVMPYHVGELYNAFTYAEFAASAILPFCFLFVTRICKNKGPLNVVGLAVSYALLVLAHVPIAFVGSIALLVYSLSWLRRETPLPIFLKLSSGAVLGAVASSFYWIRMITEFEFVRHATSEFSVAAYDFHSNFALSYFYVGAEKYSAGSLWFCDLVLLMSAMFFVPALLASIPLIKRRSLLPLIALLFLGLFMATPVSLPVWEHFPLLQKVQFPWRWLAIISMAGAVISALSFDCLTRFFPTQRRPVAILIGGLVLTGAIFTATQVIRPVNYFSLDEFAKLMQGLQDAKSYECWWPVWANKKALSVTEKVSITDRKYEIESWQPNERRLDIDDGAPQTVRIATFWYPRWRAEVNGSPVEVSSDENGAILIPVPAEKATVRLWFQETRGFYIACWISAITWLIILSILGYKWLRQGMTKSKI